MLMQGHQLCVCELSDALDLPQYKISRGLAQLKKAQLVADHRQGTWIYYSITKDDARRAALLQSLKTYFSTPAQPADDAPRLSETFSQDIQRLEQRLQLRSQGCCVVGFK
ncbi:MAG: helix-turn-helix domain-containing protein, partial [Cyclonatronaceae bacterium]